MSEKSVILGDVIQRIDEVSEQRRLERHEKSRRDQELQDTGAPIRAFDVGSSSTVPRVSDEDGGEE